MIFFQFLSWHYILGLKTVLSAWFNFIVFAFHLFSVKILLKTLFVPWHRVEINTQKPGFSLEKFFEKLTFNTISRLIGFFVRSVLIFLGLLFALIFLVLGFFVLVLWLVIPWFTWILYLSELKNKVKDGGKLAKKEEKFVLQRLGLKDVSQLANVSQKDIDEIRQWYKTLEDKNLQQKRFWQLENLFTVPAIGTDLAYGFTINLDKCCNDLSLPLPFFHQLVGREKEVKQIEQVLIRGSQNHVLLVGDPGVGKHTIILGLAKAIREKRIHPKLFNKRVLELNMNFLLGQSSSLREIKALFESLLKEAEMAGNIILVIDQLEKYIVGRQEGVDLTPVFSSMMLKSKIHLIAITTPANFERFIFPNQQITKYFEKVEVLPLTKQEALNILKQVLPDFEQGKKVIITLPALKEIVYQSDRLITNIPFPEKAIDLLDQIIAEAESYKKEFVLVKDVDQLISTKTKVPVGELSNSEVAKLKNFTTILHQRIIGQNEAIKALTSAMQRARLQLSEEDKPMGSFLFLGPTGVGKTETAKVLAEGYFGSQDQMVRFDMSQFQDSTAVSTLIGSSITDKPGLLVKEIRENPYGVLLLDEFEKANPEILNLFLTVFDEGYLKDPQGNLVSFKNIIIICTSNAGAEFIRNQVKDSKLAFDQLQRWVIEFILKQGYFTPELLNRFDGVIVYQPLDRKQIEVVSKLMLEKLVSRMAKKKIILTIDKAVFSQIAQIGYSLEFGARPIKRLIADKIETLLAKQILEAGVVAKDKLKLTLDSQTKEFKIDKVN